MAGKRTWACRYCGARTKSSADTWPEVRPEPDGHVHRFEPSRPGRPRRDPVDEPTEGPELAGDTVDLDELEDLDRLFAEPVGAWIDRRRGRKR
jgi:hypothetical protein